MSQASSLQTLDLILEDISAEINLTISALDRFQREPKSRKLLRKSKAHLNRLKGVFTLLEMPAAMCLVVDSIKLINGLSKCNQVTKHRLLESLSVALVRLIRYCEHVNQKEFALPQLLLPSINELRATINAPRLDESAFFECDSRIKRKNKSLTFITSDESAAKSRHFRQMYQIGLIEVLRQTNLNGGLKMMKKSMAKLDDECPRPNSPNLWWLAQGMLDGYIKQGLVLTKTRLRLFSRLDRQIHYLENKPVSRLNDNQQETRKLAHEMLYLTWISGVKTQTILRLLSHFNLSDPVVGDKMIRNELDELRGPSDQDYSSIAEALLEEIESIHKTLTQACEKGLNFLDLEQIKKQMINLNNLLKILQVDDQIVRLSVAIDLIDHALKEKQQLGSKDTNILFLVLDSIKEAIDGSKLAEYSGVIKTQRNKINASQLKICEATDVLVKELIKDISLFVKQERKRKHLKHVEVHITKIKQGFEQLKVDKVDKILDACLAFVIHQLLRNPHTTSDTAIELFADAISSIEFYLETLKFTIEPSPRILEFAEDSLLQLQSGLNQ